MSNNILLKEFKLNKKLILKNRILMAPMTRVKADDDWVPTQAMAEYYARRADAGLIITEGTIIRADGTGYKNAPGIFTEKQIQGWKRVTDKVHENNGLIFAQIWHVGRVSHPYFLNGELPISASETIMSNRISRTKDLNYGKSRAASLEEIQQLIADYASAARNAIKAGFDGVEIHGANGYLIDQFLHYSTNKRTDKYGGNPENMARFALEVVKACGETIGYEHVGLRLSPGAYLNEIVGEKSDALVFKHLLQELNNLPIAYIHTGNFDDTRIFPELDNMTMTEFLRSNYQGILIACGSYSSEKAQQQIINKDFDLIAIGRPFIANPDLIKRLQENKPLQTYDASMLNELH